MYVHCCTVFEINSLVFCKSHWHHAIIVYVYCYNCVLESFNTVQLTMLFHHMYSFRCLVDSLSVLIVLVSGCPGYNTLASSSTHLQ